MRNKRNITKKAYNFRKNGDFQFLDIHIEEGNIRETFTVFKNSPFVDIWRFVENGHIVSRKIENLIFEFFKEERSRFLSIQAKEALKEIKKEK